MSLTKTIKYYGDDDEVTVELPAHYEVCSRCGGEGRHTNPAIDGNGLSESDFDADPDFKEAYFAGAYDVPCEVCGGQRVEAVVDVESLSAENKEHWERYQEHLDAEHRMRLEHLAEVRFGA
jgi:hypothetical protein